MKPKELSLVLQKWQSRLEGPILELFIFHVISQKPRYGGEIVELARMQISENIKRPTVYSILKRKKGFFKEYDNSEKDSITRGERRKYYSLNQAGKAYLKLMMLRLQPTKQFLYSLESAK